MQTRSQQQVPIRRIRPVERQPMKEWITDLLDSGEVPSLTWLDKQKKEFRIKWCHGSRHGWSLKDADLFEKWALHTGRYYFGGKEDPKRWKANFRCALNSLKTIEEVRSKSVVKGSNAYRVYRMTEVGQKETKFQRDMRNGRKTQNTGLPLGTNGTHQDIIPKREESPSEEEEMESEEDTTDEEEIRITKIPEKQSASQRLQVEGHRQVVLKTSESKGFLPNFDKISPGIDKIEYGKMHCLTHHSCGFTVNRETTSERVSPANKLKIILPASFQAKIAEYSSIQRTRSSSIQDRYMPARVVFPESPEASDASPQSCVPDEELPVQDEEMVELGVFEVSEEVTISSSGNESHPYTLTELGNQWQQTLPQSQSVTTLANFLTSKESHDQIQSSIGWMNGYSPLTPP